MRALLTYFKESWHELEKVTWPDRKTTIQLTVAVIILSLLVGGFIAAVDYGLTEVLQQIILGL
ncbi:MAG: preprotein translocase subunit SecE [Candidatus Saccharimonadales bacterium]